MGFEWDVDAIGRYFGPPELFWSEDGEVCTEAVYRFSSGNLRLELAFDCCDVTLNVLAEAEAYRPFSMRLWRAKRFTFHEEGERAWFDFPRAALELPVYGPPDAQAAVRLHVKPHVLLELR